MVTEAIFGMSDERVTKTFFGISDELKQELKQELKDAVKEALEPLEPCYKNNGSGGDKIGLFDNNSDAYQGQDTEFASLTSETSELDPSKTDYDFGFDDFGFDAPGFDAPSFAATG